LDVLRDAVQASGSCRQVVEVLAQIIDAHMRSCEIPTDNRQPNGNFCQCQSPLASTEFTYSRFLTPALAGYRGWALFCDCDFLWLDDIAGLVEYTRVPKAVYCV